MGDYVTEVMSGMPADLSPQQSVESVLKVISGLCQEDNGRFLDWKGDPMDF